MNHYCTWLTALAEQDVRAVPKDAAVNTATSNGTGAMAYPVIVVNTTSPAK